MPIVKADHLTRISAALLAREHRLDTVLDLA